MFNDYPASNASIMICVLFCLWELICSIWFRKIRSLRNTIHQNLCFVLFAAELLFLLGISRTEQKVCLLSFLAKACTFYCYYYCYYSCNFYHCCQCRLVESAGPGGLQPPPRFWLKLTFYQLTIIVKSKKEAKSINHIKFFENYR